MHALLTTEPPVRLLEACKRWDYRHAPRHLASIFLSQPVFSILTAIPQLVHSHGALSWRLPTNSRWFPVKDLKKSSAVSTFLPSSCSLIGYRLFPISNLLTLNCLSWWFTLPRGCKPSAFSNYLSKAHYIWLMFKKKKSKCVFLKARQLAHLHGAEKYHLPEESTWKTWANSGLLAPPVFDNRANSTTGTFSTHLHLNSH